VTGPCLVGLLAILAFGALGPRLGRRLRPALATRLLVAGAVAVAVLTVVFMALVGVTAVAQLPAVARYGQWSRPVLDQTDPVPVWLAATCTALLALALLYGLYALARRCRALVALHRTCRGMGPARSIIVLRTDRPEAFATPVGRGRIVVTTGMLRALRPPERRALFAHETAHLAHHHAWWTAAADLAAAVNPLLGPTARAVSHAVERWADESAAAALADRRLVARALARAALHVDASRRGRPVPAGALDVVGGDVPARVRALLAPVPRGGQLLPVLALAGLLAVSMASAGTARARVDHFLDHAGAPSAPYRHGGGPAGPGTDRADLRDSLQTAVSDRPPGWPVVRRRRR